MPEELTCVRDTRVRGDTGREESHVVVDAECSPVATQVEERVSDRAECRCVVGGKLDRLTPELETSVEAMACVRERRLSLENERCRSTDSGSLAQRFVRERVEARVACL